MQALRQAVKTESVQKSKSRHITFLVCIFFQIWDKFELSQGSAGTCLRYGGKYYMCFAVNLILFLGANEF